MICNKICLFVCFFDSHNAISIDKSSENSELGHSNFKAHVCILITPLRIGLFELHRLQLIYLLRPCEV